MKISTAFTLLFLPVATVQGFTASSSSGRGLTTALAESLPTYIQEKDVVRADLYDTWLPADPKEYQAKRTQPDKVKYWVPFVSDPYGHSTVQDYEEEEAPEKLPAPKLLSGMRDTRDNKHLWN